MAREDFGGQRPPLQFSQTFRPILDGKNFARIWPVAPFRNEARPHGILANVFPFLRSGFFATQYVIKESFLPVRRDGPAAAQFRRKHSFERARPGRKRYALVIETYKRMEMVRQYHIGAYPRAVLGAFRSEVEKG